MNKKSEDYYIPIHHVEDDETIITSEPRTKTQKSNNPINRQSQTPLKRPQPQRRPKRIRRNKQSFFQRRKKLIAIIGIIIILYLFYDSLLNIFLNILKANPTFYKHYLALEAEIANNTLKGLFYTSVLGSLFFLALPSEALFIYFLNATQYPMFIIISLMVFGNIAGLIFNYLFGRLFGEEIVRRIFAKSFNKYQQNINDYGGFIILFGNIVPGPIEILSVFYGSFRFPLSRYIYLCFLGRLIKYLILIIIFLFYWDSIMMFYEEIINELLIIKSTIAL